MPEFDFGFGGNETTNVESPKEQPTEDITTVEGGSSIDTDPNTDKTEITPDGKPEDKQEGEKGEKETKEDNNEEALEPGTVIEFGDDKYTVDENGNIVDKDGKMFKEAKDVAKWLKSVEHEETEDNSPAVVDIQAVKKAIGVDIVDEDGNAIEFENTPEGVASYVKSYIENSKQAIQDATIDALYAKYPIIENVINYYVANGNSLEGFNELKDRSRIELDVNNEAQCEAIIREAWKEESRRGNVDQYIQYLKSQNLLGATAQDELEAMVAKDKAAADNLAKEAARKEEEYIESQKQYWGDINKRVNSDKRIGKYQIPDTIIRVHNGQRTSATPQDFFNYIYQVDKNGRSQYENDLIREANESPEERLNNDLIAAYLKFTGGSYESLVNMAINEQQVKTIKIKSKQTRTPSVKINRPAGGNKDKKIDFGY